MNTKVDEGKLISGLDIPRLVREEVGFQFRTPPNGSYQGGSWVDFRLDEHEEEFTIGDLINPRYEFRLKPKTILINGNECPAPILWDSLPEGTKFWIADPSRHDGEFCRHLVWDGQDCDVQHLQRGLVHLSKQDAVDHAKAIILASGGSYE